MTEQIQTDNIVPESEALWGTHRPAGRLFSLPAGIPGQPNPNRHTLSPLPGGTSDKSACPNAAHPTREDHPFQDRKKSTFFHLSELHFSRVDQTARFYSGEPAQEMYTHFLAPVVG